MFATVRIDTPLTTLKMFENIAKDGGCRSCRGGRHRYRRAKIVYIERKPGIFEGVVVELGPQVADITRSSKFAAGAKHRRGGIVLIDAETRLKPVAVAYTAAVGTKAESHQAATSASAASADVSEKRSRISKSFRRKSKPAKEQKVCPITNQPLGSMGVPVAISLDGKKFSYVARLHRGSEEKS